MAFINRMDMRYLEATILPSHLIKMATGVCPQCGEKEYGNYGTASKVYEVPAENSNKIHCELWCERCGLSLFVEAAVTSIKTSTMFKDGDIETPGKDDTTSLRMDNDRFFRNHKD